MQNQIPEILYKYRCFDGRAISMLANNQIYFASLLDFNDPFDCLALEHTFEEFREESLEMFTRLQRDVSLEATIPENTKLLIETLSQHPKIRQIKIETDLGLKEFIEKNGFLSLSARPESILMWSHYANYHKGFCIGYKNNLGINENFVIEINYSDVRNNDFVSQFLAIQNMSKEEAHRKILIESFFTKYIDWSYEKEWRIIGSQGIGIYPENSIDRIIFGAKMPLEERNTIQYILKNKEIRYFKAVKSKRHFSLDIIELVG